MNQEQKECHELALKISANFKRNEISLIDALQRVASCKVYLELHYSTPFDYAFDCLGLSEANAYTFTRIARKSMFVPELKTAIESGLVTVSNAKQIVSLITPGNQKYWLEKAATLSKRELEKEIAREHPEVAKKESVRFVSEDRVSLKLEISEQLLEKLRRAQVVLTNKKREAVSLVETLEASVDLFLQREDPVQKADRADFSREKTSGVGKSTGGMVRVASKRRMPIPAHIRHQVHRRDRGQCCFVSADGVRCRNHLFLELHHKIPVSQGGANSLENITTRCSQHHRYGHEKQNEGVPPKYPNFGKECLT